MTRSAAQRQQDRDELLRLLEEQGPMATGDLIATAAGLKEVHPDSPVYSRVMSDLLALALQRLVMQVKVEEYFGGWALADQSVLDELDDLADVQRQSTRWEAVDA